MRVVVTGIGLVSAIGIGRDEAFGAAVAGRSGAGPITLFDSEGFGARIACEATDFVPEDFLEKRAARRMDRYAQLAVAAARLATADAALEIADDGMGTGAIIATGGGGGASREEQHRVLMERGPDRVSPLAIPQSVCNMGAAQVSMELGLRGPISTTCNACAAGTDAIGHAAAILRRGDAEVMLAGGSDAMITPLWVAGFDAMRVLSRRNDDPIGAARPFDVEREGFLVGEAGAVLVLEPLEHARARGARIICEVLGYGRSADAHHISDPDPTGAPQAAAITACLHDAGLAPEEIDYINAHGGGSQPGDPTELRAIAVALGAETAARVPLSATKPLHGHCMGATGALEAGLTAMAIERGVIPPTINLNRLDPDCDHVDHVANEAREAPVRVALSSSFGLGGHNAVVALGQVEGDA